MTVASPRLPLRFNELALAAAIFVVIVVTATVDSNHSYLTQPGTSFKDIARNVALLGIFALGAAVVIIAGGIDLSAGSMVAFSATTCALILVLFAEESDKRLVTVSTFGTSTVPGGVTRGGITGAVGAISRRLNAGPCPTAFVRRFSDKDPGDLMVRWTTVDCAPESVSVEPGGLPVRIASKLDRTNLAWGWSGPSAFFMIASARWYSGAASAFLPWLS